jgi:NPCBM/NEW2 domain-containing protein
MSLTSNPNPPSSKSKWHSAPWWTSVAVVVAVIGLAITYAAWQHPHSPEDGQAAPVAPASSTTGPTISTTTGSFEASSSNTSLTSSSAPSSDQAGGPAVSNSNQIYLSDIPEGSFIREPSQPARGAATVDSHEYPSSYSYRFTNCSNCTYNVEVNLPNSYTRFTGVFGLTDETMHDDLIDGVVYFSVYSSAGDLLLAPHKVEYPAKVPFDINVTGVNRIRLTVSNGTNAEYPCWCDARFAK